MPPLGKILAGALVGAPLATVLPTVTFLAGCLRMSRRWLMMAA